MLKRYCWKFFLLGLLLLFPVGGAVTAGSASGPGPVKDKKTLSSDRRESPVKQVKAEGGSRLSAAEQKQLLARIRKKFRRPELMQGFFTQTTTFADTSDTMVASGRIWLQGPDKMRWEYAEPEKQVLVSDGRKIWYYTPDLNQVMTGSVKDIKEARIIVSLLSRLDDRIEGFDLTVSRTGNRLLLVLVPQKGSKAPPFEKLEIFFSEPRMNLAETRMVDLFANRIAITYRWDGPPAPPRPEAFFMFVPPRGCDVMPLGR